MNNLLSTDSTKGFYCGNFIRPVPLVNHAEVDAINLEKGTLPTFGRYRCAGVKNA